MPSLLKLLEDAEVLAAVKAEGLRRRRHRHRRNLVIGGLGLVLAGIPAYALLGGDDGGNDLTVAAGDDDRSEDRTERSTTTTVPYIVTVTTQPDTEVLGNVIERETTTTRPPRGTSPTTAPLVCRNSYDQRCGDFSWDPAPAPNQPLVLSADDVPVLAPDDTHTITVHWSDGDASLGFRDDDADGVLLAGACAVEQRFGPWTPPAPAGGAGQFTIDYTAPAEPGTYAVTVIAETAVCDGYHPYRSDATLVITVTVEEPSPTCDTTSSTSTSTSTTSTTICQTP